MNCLISDRLKVLKDSQKTNIILIGPPGAGKTTLGRLISQKLNCNFIDIDDHHLEKVWNCSVVEKLAQCGDEKFIQEEGNAVMKLEAKETVISSTGSNPLQEQSMQHLQKLGFIVLLDVPMHEIIERQKKMKVSRIVGQASKTLEEILNYRQECYQKVQYDMKIFINQESSLEDIRDIIIQQLTHYDEYISTRDQQNQQYSFADTIVKGLAPDGGLFVPQKFPVKFKNIQIQQLINMSFHERAQQVLQKFIQTTIIPPQNLNKIIQKAYQRFYHKEILPIDHLCDNLYIMEEFHGPSGSFKDYSLQLTPILMNTIFKSQNNNNKLALLVATSGDTGSAALDGFGFMEGIPTVVLFPKQGISSIQKKQMITTTGNNLVLQIESDFDFCQSLTKKLYNDVEFNQILNNELRITLSTGNSMNWGRLVPQVVYSISGYCDLVKKGQIKFGEPVDVCVPSGNFGNLLSVFYAQNLGIPIRKLICASNKNNILYEAFTTEVYDISKRNLIKTYSPAIDILISSNFERLLHFLVATKGYDEDKNIIYNNNEKTEANKIIQELFSDLQQKKSYQLPKDIQIKEKFTAGWCDEEQCQETIKNIYNQNGKLLDPHTAVAVNVAQKLKQENPSDFEIPILIAGTAHWSKFPEVICKSFDINFEENEEPFELFEKINKKTRALQNNPVHPAIVELQNKEVIHKDICKPDYDEIKQKIVSFFKQNN